MTKDQCPDCHAGEKWILNGPTGAQETCKHPWHGEALTSKTVVCYRFCGAVDGWPQLKEDPQGAYVLAHDHDREIERLHQALLDSQREVAAVFNAAVAAKPAPEPPQPGAKARVSDDDLQACRSWLAARGDSLARSGDMIRMVDELLERRAEKAAADAEPTAEQATHYAFLWRRPIDSEPWAAIYTSRELAEAFRHRVSDVVQVRLRLKDRDTGEAGG